MTDIGFYILLTFWANDHTVELHRNWRLDQIYPSVEMCELMIERDPELRRVMAVSREMWRRYMARTRPEMGLDRLADESITMEAECRFGPWVPR